MSLDGSMESSSVNHVMRPKEPQYGINCFGLDLGDVESMAVVLQVPINIFFQSCCRDSEADPDTGEFCSAFGVGCQLGEVLVKGGNRVGDVFKVSEEGDFGIVVPWEDACFLVQIPNFCQYFGESVGNSFECSIRRGGGDSES